MSGISNEKYTETKLAKEYIADKNSGANCFSEEDLTSEDEFRGFETIPTVRIERFNITKYLDDVKFKTGSVQTKKEAAENSVSKFMQKCTVNLVQDDLDQLKDMFTKNVLLNKELDLVWGKGASLKCKICQKAYSSEKKLQNHQENKHLLVYKPQSKPRKRVSFADHVTIHEVKEYHRCRKCPKIFENYTALKVHMKRKHKKRKCYICNYCSKKFVDRMFFKVHIKLHCDICGHLLLNKRKLMEHRRYVCNVIKKYICKTCDESYFKFMDLKEHSYDHLVSVFICDICKDQYKRKCEVAHHIKFLHSKKRPKNLYDVRILGSERLYLCRFCDESSVEREVIENHVSTLPDLTNKTITGYKDFYFCDQCFKKFPTETEMLQHKWSHFLNSTDNSQERPKPKSKKIRQVYNVSEKLPEFLLPQLVLERIKIGGRAVSEPLKFVKAQSVDLVNGEIKKPVIDPVSKKTIISKHQCSTCNKYLSSTYCLNRHIAKVHKKLDDLNCDRCEETFVWPSLLLSHRCIHDNPEIAIHDVTPETQLQNDMSHHYLDDLIISNDNYMLDFEIPAPIVELTEYENYNIVVSDGSSVANPKICLNPLSNRKIVVQEVPIEF